MKRWIMLWVWLWIGILAPVDDGPGGEGETIPGLTMRPWFGSGGVLVPLSDIRSG
jgi:hypothetical protein